MGSVEKVESFHILGEAVKKVEPLWENTREDSR